MHRNPLLSSFFILSTTLLFIFSSCGGQSKKSTSADTIALATAPTFIADSAMAYVEAQCAFGPRVPGSAAHEACGDWLAQQFTTLGTTVSEQRTELAGYDGKLLPCRNIMASFHPEATDRILITAHWDSRAWADNDRDAANHHTPVLAANDGASGVAVMLEMARVLPQLPLDCGVDFVCFDLEDQGTPQWAEDDDETDDYNYWCLGSRYWANEAYATGYSARYAINLDMVGGRGARFEIEGFSQQYAAPLVNMVWHLAAQLGYGDYFPLRRAGYITDDHVSVSQFARIPAIDIVPHVSDGHSSFGPTWHTINDTPENIDPAVLKAVGQTLLQLLYNDNNH
ncbi:MAG: M28 family peptidase [Bacteroidaceae bacterium]|nr:M28 family peptidase [Bacteroidaceae bacterium]